MHFKIHITRHISGLYKRMRSLYAYAAGLLFAAAKIRYNRSCD